MALVHIKDKTGAVLATVDAADGLRIAPADGSGVLSGLTLDLSEQWLDGCIINVSGAEAGGLVFNGFNASLQSAQFLLGNAVLFDAVFDASDSAGYDGFVLAGFGDAEWADQN